MLQAQASAGWSKWAKVIGDMKRLEEERNIERALEARDAAEDHLRQMKEQVQYSIRDQHACAPSQTLLRVGENSCRSSSRASTHRRFVTRFGYTY